MSAAAPDGSVTFWQQDDRRWRWRWTEAPPSQVTAGSGPDRGSLVSNEAFDSVDEARSSAAEAFPDAALLLAEDQRAPEQRHRRHHRRRAVLLAAVLVLVVLEARRRHR